MNAWDLAGTVYKSRGLAPVHRVIVKSIAMTIDCGTSGLGDWNSVQLQH